jgi:hypothetical protein
MAYAGLLLPKNHDYLIHESAQYFPIISVTELISLITKILLANTNLSLFNTGGLHENN